MPPDECGAVSLADLLAGAAAYGLNEDAVWDALDSLEDKGLVTCCEHGHAVVTAEGLRVLFAALGGCHDADYVIESPR